MKGYQQRYFLHIRGMSPDRVPRRMPDCKPQGEREGGRLLLRWKYQFMGKRDLRTPGILTGAAGVDVFMFMLSGPETFKLGFFTYKGKGARSSAVC
jgi:hypothetical protein